MGFYYFIMLFIGIFLVLGAILRLFFKKSTLSKKMGVFSFIIGISLIGLSIFFFTRQF